MSSRENILSAVKESQPVYAELPILENYIQSFTNLKQQFTLVLEGIGGKVHEVNNMEEIIVLLQRDFPNVSKMVTLVDGLYGYAGTYGGGEEPHASADLDVLIIGARFGVAENGSVWVTETDMRERVLPFICQHLVAVIDEIRIVSTMHDAYDLIAEDDYGFGTFIAGPSKTADIEQSLVLGAHGARTMTVYILNRQ